MKKLVYSILALAAVFATSSCDQSRLDIPQKGVSAYESFYKTDSDCEEALVAAYAGFSTYVTGRGNAYIYTPYKAALNLGGDDTFGAGSNFGDNDYMAAMDEFRYDSGCEVIRNFYSGLFLANYRCNLVIDNFKNGLPDGGKTAVTERCVAEARVLRAYIYFLLTSLWNTPPFIDHVIADGLPYNSDKDPDNPMTHEDLYKWIASECDEAAANLDERKSQDDKDGAVKVTKGFAWALQGKALLFVGDYTGAKTALKKVIDSNKYALVDGKDYWQNFHIEGDGNKEKVFETNLEYKAGLGVWSGINQRSTWMEANIWGWRSDHFATPPQTLYTGGQDGWGGLGVPQWFGDEFYANDGNSYRFDATLKHIDDAVYNMPYAVISKEGKSKKSAAAAKEAAEYEMNKVGAEMAEDGETIKKVGYYNDYQSYWKYEATEKETGDEKEPIEYTCTIQLDLADVPADELKNGKAIGIYEPKDGLYGQSFWLGFKQLLRKSDTNPTYGGNVRLNNNIVMRYAEVLLLYAEACIQSGDSGEASKYIKMIQERAGSKNTAGGATMDVLKKEKSYELWLEGCRFLDILRWGDTDRIKNAGSNVPKLFDKLFREPKSGEQVTWENGTEANSRFYTVVSHEARDKGFPTGYQDKNRFLPYPTTVMEKNPNLVQNPGWE